MNEIKDTEQILASAEAHFRAHEYTEAAFECSRAVVLRPHDADIHYSLGLNLIAKFLTSN